MKILSLLIFLFILTNFICCKEKNKRTDNQELLLIKEREKTDLDIKFENLKTPIFSSEYGISNKQRIIDSMIFSISFDSIFFNKGQALYGVMHDGDYICLFNYDYNDTSISNILKLFTNDCPHGFINCIKNRVPIYLLVSPREQIKHGHPAGNKFADAGLRRQDVGQGYDYGNYGAFEWTETLNYTLSFLYLDRKFDTTDVDYKGALFNNLSTAYLFGVAEIGKTKDNENVSGESIIFRTGEKKRDKLGLDDKIDYSEKYKTLVGYFFYKYNKYKTTKDLEEQKIVYFKNGWWRPTVDFDNLNTVREKYLQEHGKYE